MTNPNKVSLRDLAGTLPETIDVFICSASFESRSTAIATSLPKQKVARALVCANEDFSEYVGTNLAVLMGHFGDVGHQVDLSQRNPVQGLDSLLAALHCIATAAPRRIVVDVTTFTHEGLLVLVRLLAAKLRVEDELTIVYTPASEYALGLPPPDKWLSRGLRDIRSVLGFPGLMVPGQKLHLIVLVGFEAERARLLIDACEPDVISLGRAHDATDSAQAHLPINVDTLEQLSIHYEKVSQFKFSSVDVTTTQAALANQAFMFPGCNVVVAPMNTKLSTLGAALLGFARKDIQLCYAPAYTYNFSGYSTPCDFCLVTRVDLPLENPAALR
jgi:hypothetical protein